MVNDTELKYQRLRLKQTDELDADTGAIFPCKFVRDLIDAYEAANARIAELEAAIEDSAYSPIEIVPLEDAFDTLTEYFHDVLLWNEPEFVMGRAAVDTVRFAINENVKRIAELEAWKAAVPVKSIGFIVGNSGPDLDMLSYWEDNEQPYTNAQFEVLDWVRQVQP